MKTFLCCCHDPSDKDEDHDDRQRKDTDYDVLWLEKEFADTTSCHGLSIFKASSSTCARILWGILLLGNVYPGYNIPSDVPRERNYAS